MAGGRTRRSGRSARRLPEPEAERVVISSDDEQDITQDPIVRDGTSSLPDGGFSALPEEQQDELVKRMVRFMVCRNARKKPVTRQDLYKHIFANMTNIRSKQKVFNGTLSQAQHKLRNVFGMRMVEIQKQLKRGSSQTQKAATASASQGTTAGMKGFILVSELAVGQRVEDKKNKALIGFLTVVGGMILLEPGCRIEQAALYRSLAKIGVHVRDTKGHKQLNGGNVKDLMERILPGQWYLEREKEGNAYSYTLGPRFRAEIEDKDLIEFINAVYTGGGERDSTLDETSRKELQMRLDEASGVAQDEMEEE